jgi:hypothetical protein
MRSIVGAVLLLVASGGTAQEPVAASKVVAANLFKNGLAVIRREIVLPGPGTFRIEDLPEPVHGTWWVESKTAVETMVKMREVETPAGSDVDFQNDFAGKKVSVLFRDGKLAPVSGMVLKLPPPRDEPRVDIHGRAPHQATGRFLVLKTTTGRLYIDPAQIAALELNDRDEPIHRERKPFLLISAPAAAANEKVHVSYLTHGLAWAPSYRVDISDRQRLELELAAVIKNELPGLTDADLHLISGFPSVQFAHVRSPLSPLQSWESFFAQLAGGRPRAHHLLSQQVITNAQAPTPAFGLAAGATPMGEGVDLHFQPIGKRTLAKGEAVSLSIARSSAAYERVVEWLIPDNRDEHGRYIDPGRRAAGADEDDEDAWDALRFKNPFAFPMTTGPALVTAQGRFNGQRTSYYVNAGEETTLRITKALSIRTRHAEQEIVGKDEERAIVSVGGHTYRKSTVAAELLVSNHRAEAIKLIIRRRFSGDLLSAEGQPHSSLREEGIWSVNKRNELTWMLTLKGGEDRRLNYRYSVLVRH